MSPKLQARLDALLVRRQELDDELVLVLSLRSANRMLGIEHDPELLRRAQALTRAALETKRDALRLHADIVDEQIDQRSTVANPFIGLTVPDFLPEVDL